jgi:hypothetical protein
VIPRLGAWVLAIATVLCGVPSSAFAASNELSSGSATPAAGTTQTPFTLSVDYVGAFPAIGVTAVAGGRELPMLIASGDALAGRWTTTGLLPAGTWVVRFVATTSHGPDPALDGPAVTVTDVTSPTPAASSPGNGGSDQPPTHSSPVGGGSTEPAPTEAPAAPMPTGSPDPDSPATPGDGEPAPDASVADSVPTVRDTGTAVGASAGGTTSDGSVEPGSSETMASSALTVASPETGAARPAVSDVAPEATTSAWLGLGSLTEPSLPITAALASLAALGGIVALVLWRRRPTAPAGPTGEIVSIDDEVAAALHRRVVRRAGRRPTEEDPIVASLGIGEMPAPKPATRRRAARRQDGPRA